MASFDHQNEVNHAVFSPDGARILTASSDKTAKLWDATLGKLIVSFKHQDEVLYAAFSADGARILTASKDKTAKLWDASSEKFSASFAHQEAVANAAFSANGARVLTASTDHSVNLWDMASGKLIASFEHLGWPFQAAFSPDGARLLTANEEYYSAPVPEHFIRSLPFGGLTTNAIYNSAKLWDAISGRLMASFEHQDAIHDAVFSSDGTWILTASADKTAKLWDATSGKLLGSFDNQADVTRVAFSPDGARILTTGDDATAKLWDAASGKLIASFDHPETGSVWFGTFSPDGARILTVESFEFAKLWDAASGRLIASFDHLGHLWERFLEADRPVLHFSPDGARILTTSGDNSAKLWDAASGKLVTSFPHQGEVFQAEFSSDGARVLTASADKTAKLWDAASGKLIASFDHPDGLYHAAFSPHDARILTASWDKTAKLWDAATPVELARQVKEARGATPRIGSSFSMAGSPVLQIESLSEIASGLEFSDDGSLVAVNEENRSKLAKQVKDLAQGLDPNARFIRWFFSPASNRTIFPASDVEIAEWVDNALLTNPNVTEEWVRNALVLLPNHPLLHIALAGSETDSKRADFLRSFGLARLPRSSIICTRAGEMLLAQDRPNLALAAVDQALLSDPKDLPAQRLRLKIVDAMPRSSAP
jgi:WD40 repeat protein